MSDDIQQDAEDKAKDLRQRQSQDRDDLGNETADRGWKIKRFTTERATTSTERDAREEDTAQLLCSKSNNRGKKPTTYISNS